MDERRLVAFAAGAVTGLGLHNAVVLLANRHRSVALSRQLVHDALVGTGDARPLRLVMTGDSGIAGNGLEDLVSGLRAGPPRRCWRSA